MTKKPLTKKLSRRLKGIKTITITLTHEHQTERVSGHVLEEEFADNVTEISLSDKARDADIQVWKGKRLLGWIVDLSPLSNFKRLEVLSLDGNSMPEVDLRPVASCSELKKIVLSHNRLHAVDLTPLASCSKLEELHLDWNELSAINLQPLASCHNLRKISLRKNLLRDIELTGLGQCPNLEELDIEYNAIETVNLNPLSSCHKLKALRVCAGNSLNIRLVADSWALLWAIASGSFDQIYTQYILSQTLGLSKYGMLDSRFLRELCAIPPDTQIDRAKEEVRSILVQKMCEQIDSEGTTIGLRIDEILKEGKNADLIVRAEDVVRLRREEMDRVEVTWNEDAWEGAVYAGVRATDSPRYDLRALYLTAYGNQIINALRMPLLINGRGLEEVVDSCKRIGHDIKVVPGEFVSPVEMTKEMERLIFALNKF
ncbi:MAG: leucine-rich repeat domain-containing protein [Promethearchaeota archaeon]